MREINTTSAIAEAVRKEMARDKNTVLMGEDIIYLNGSFGIFKGCIESATDRCLDMPCSENGFTHFANGLAYAGMRPIVDYNISDFVTIALDGIVNGAATARFCTLGNLKVPITYMMCNGGFSIMGGGGGAGCNHSQCMESLFLNTPGLKVVMPYYPSDIHGLLRASIQDDDPVVFFYCSSGLGAREKVAFTEEDDYIIPLNNASRIVREGKDITIVALQSMVPVVVEAAAALEKKGIYAEVIDPRVLIPFDSRKVIDSVRKTGRLIVVHETHTRGSFAGEIIRKVAEEDPAMLKKPVKVLGAQNTPIGSAYYESYIMPHAADVIAATEEIM